MLAPHHPRRTPVIWVVAALVGVALSACANNGDELVVYSGRNSNLVAPILERFADDTGIDIRVRYADTTSQLATILEEGRDRTRADVFLSQDAGALGELALEGFLARLPERTLDLVEPRFRDPEGRWIGVTGRARVIAYNTDELSEADLPSSVLELTEPEWRGRVGFPPSNASFIAFVSALREEIGDERTREFLVGLKENGAERYDNNIVTLDAVAAGEISVGLVNHYYLYNEFQERPNAPAANFFPGQEQGGEGTFINVSGVAILENSDQKDLARRFVDYLLGESAQEFFRNETAEYPLRTGIDAIPDLPRLSELQTIDVPLTQLGRDLQGTLEMLKDVGLT